MSRYSWPSDIGRKERKDDAVGRANHNTRRRLDFDPDGALRASRTPQRAAPPPGGLPGPAAPANEERKHLWQPLGPVTLLEGQAEGRPRVSGRVNAISVHPDGQRAYAASANGGIWYTKDGGANWISLAGSASTDTAGIVRPAHRNACGAIHVEFGNAEGEDLVFLGTGEVTHPITGQLPIFSEGGIGILVANRPVKTVESNPNTDPWLREAPNLVNNGVFRIARERKPNGIVMAATRTGLFQRPAAPGPEIKWERPPEDWNPFNLISVGCSDILWTPRDGTIPERWWVWVKDGADAGLWVRPYQNVTNKFTRLDVDGASGLSFTDRRACLAASTPASQIWVLNDRGEGKNPALFRVTNPAENERPKAHGVVGVPNILHESGFYNIAMDVDPANPNRVALAGSYLQDRTEDGGPQQYNASIVVAEVAANPGNENKLTYGHPAPYKMIGVGVHPDVHALAYSNGGATLWAGCDGGIFRSDRPEQPAGFYPRNYGLSISESNYLACHPSCEGFVVAGLQDNGVIERLSSNVWELNHLGDGGSVVLDPILPRRYISQYVRGEWQASDSTFTIRDKRIIGQNNLLMRNGSYDETESEASAFYSTAAGIAHSRGTPAPAAPNIGQIIIGTTRLWYTERFGAPRATPADPPTWVTLPTGTDPLPRGDSTQDSFGQAITVCRWQSPDVAWVLGRGRLMRYARTLDSDNAGGPGTWTRETMIKESGWSESATTQDAILKAPVWTDIAVNLDPSPGLNEPPRQRGSKGALYLGTVGNPDDSDVDTLWWFDGTSKWFKTDLRNDPDGVPAPVTAIVCDPDFPDEVYVGTTVGVWKGIRTQIGEGSPVWTWHKRLTGLPEAPVEDLAIFSDKTRGLRLLRAAIASRGIWELRLDVAEIEDLTYIRAHDDDLRYVAPAEVPPPDDPFGPKVRELRQRDGRTDRSWHGSPDVRPRTAPELVPAPLSLRLAPWRRRAFPGATEQLRRFQTALRASTRDPRIVPNGIWDVYFSEVLRDHGAPTLHIPATPTEPAHNAVQINEAFWNLHMHDPHSTVDPWSALTPADAGRPTEADLYELLERIPEGDADRVSHALPPRRAKIEIVVHRRGLKPISGDQVRVVLLKWIDPKRPRTANASDAATWFSGNVPWTGAVNDVLNSDAGTTTRTFADGWSFVVGTDGIRRRTLSGQELDPMRSGVVSFEFDDLNGQPRDLVVLLVAIIHTVTDPPKDIALTPNTLRELALTSPNVAVRSLRIS